MRTLSSLTDESIAEDSGELGLGLEPFARRSASLTPHEGIRGEEAQAQDGGAERKTRTAMKRLPIRSVAISCLLFAAPSFAAADKALFSSDDGNFVVFADIGLANIKAQEFFYAGDHEISQLNWESKESLFSRLVSTADRQQLELEGQRQSQHRRQGSPS